MPDNLWEFDFAGFKTDISQVVRAMDNVVDRAVYPLPQQEKEAKDKRRMGLGLTGVANTLEILGYTYGSDEAADYLAKIMTVLRDSAYLASVDLAVEKGAFPLFDVRLLESGFALTLPEHIREAIRTHGIRNSHLLSIAPTGTISLSADNVSSGIEPVFSLAFERTIQAYEGERKERVEDYAYRNYGVVAKTADELSVFDHVKMLNVASYYVDSACSKTCNVGDDVTWDQFKEVYMRAFDGGASGCTTFRASGKRYGILKASKDEEVVEETPKEEDSFIEEGGACYYDPATGLRKCE